MPESGPYGSVRGAPSNGRPYRDGSSRGPPGDLCLQIAALAVQREQSFAAAGRTHASRSEPVAGPKWRSQQRSNYACRP
jgi:hypothetical protein